MTVQTTTVPASPLSRFVGAWESADRNAKKLAIAKAKYNRLHALYTAHPTEGSRLALIKAMEKMRDIERAMR